MNVELGHFVLQAFSYSARAQGGTACPALTQLQRFLVVPCLVFSHGLLGVVDPLLFK